MRLGAAKLKVDESKRTALHLAAYAGHKAAVELLIACGLPVDCEDGFRRTPLSLAACYGHVDVVECLLNLGANIGQKNGLGMTVLHRAAMGGHVAVLELLISRGAPGIASKDGYGNTPFLIAAKFGHLAAMRCLVTHGASVEEENCHNYRAVNYAAEQGHTEAFKFLINQKADVNYYSRLTRSPIHCAVGARTLGAVKLLLQSGAQVNSWQDLLTTAIHSGSVEMIELILTEGADINGIDSQGETALSIAAYGGRIKVIRCLLGRGASVQLSKVGHRFETVVRMVMNAYLLRKEYDTCQMHLKNEKIPIPSVVRTAGEGYLKNREFYLTRGRFQEGDDPDAVFQVAAYFLDLEVMKIFKDQWLEKLRSWRYSEGKNLIMEALEMFDQAALKWLLAEKICTISDVDSEGHDALWHAIELGELSFVNEILSGDAQVTQEHLIHAASFKNCEIVARLAVLYRYSAWRNEHRPSGLNFFR